MASSGGKVITIDKGSCLEVKVHDRSYNGGTTTLLKLDEKHLDLITTAGYYIRGVPLDSMPAGSGSAISAIPLESDRADAVLGGTEAWIREWTADLSILPTTLQVRLSGSIELGGTYMVRIGGTTGQPNGTLLCTLTVPDPGGYPSSLNIATGFSFTNPGGPQVFKLTGFAAGARSTIRSPSVLIEEV